MNKKILPNSASLLLTEDCNLACKYCFEVTGTGHIKKGMTNEIAHKSLDYLVNNAIKNGDKEFSIIFFGGEPCLNPDVMEAVLDYGVALARKNKLNFSANIITNGTILNEKIKSIIKNYSDKLNLQVQLSVDGVKEAHDLYRVTKGGKGSFELIEKNIEGWKSLFKDKPNNLSLHGCLNRQTLPYLYESYAFFRDTWNVPRIWFMPIHSEIWEEEDLNIYDEQLTKVAENIIARCSNESSINEINNYAPIDRCLRPDSRPDAPCGAGKSFVTITADGDIYPCHHMYFNDRENVTKIGDIYVGIDEVKRSIYLDYTNEDMSCAKEVPDCDAYHCYRCIADNWVLNGSILSQVRGIRCRMSFIERNIQRKIKKELISMGLLNKNANQDALYAKGNNPINPACLCDLGSPKSVEETTTCNCGTENCEANDIDVIAKALEILLNKVDYIKSAQEIILKKIL